VQQVLDRHYRRLAGAYDKYLYYSPDFVRALTSKMIASLQLDPSDTLVDIGCGTGMYSLDIIHQTALQNPVIGVDPYREMLAQIPSDAQIVPIVEDALAYSRRPGAYNKVLVKETIHHVADIPEFLRNIYGNLPTGGRLLLVHVPPNVKYPLFDAALARCLNWHADPDVLVEQLHGVGFQVERDSLAYQHSLPKHHYFDMVRSQYMSVLTSFSDDEMQAGLQEMELTHHGKETLKFVDHFDFLTAVKLAA
jgi:ubiquinone/menaquinone biosynthesis C-methylase UbiE